jgi:hypothetical protein
MLNRVPNNSIVFNTLPTYPLPGETGELARAIPNSGAGSESRWGLQTMPIANHGSATLVLVAIPCKPLILKRWRIIFCSHPHYCWRFCGPSEKVEKIGKDHTLQMRGPLP